MNIAKATYCVRRVCTILFVILLAFCLSWPLASMAKKRALLIGISHYPQTTKSNPCTWTNIHGCNDVRLLRGTLQKQGFRITTLTNAQATEEAFKALDGHAPDALHIATHGFAISTMQQYDNSPFAQSRTAFTPNGNYMMWSGLVLAGGNNAWQCKPLPKGVEDGILTADEISRLDLSHTRLVVLSACETARGHIDNTDGVWGLQRAFKQAGAGTIVMTLWKVSDETTCMFMTEFYRQLANGLNTRQALKRARTYLIEQGATDPYYWAAFVAID
ncbi:CHAT domain-containing protein [Prevotellamassilia timonensis]|uniref:CHAT domain-containing protein n=1 Tax=Prevotellamassilia timonensis TaxID=1852370 RepID=UPI0030804108